MTTLRAPPGTASRWDGGDFSAARRYGSLVHSTTPPPLASVLIRENLASVATTENCETALVIQVLMIQVLGKAIENTGQQ
jgi:hypothetical protein